MSVIHERLKYVFQSFYSKKADFQNYGSKVVRTLISFSAGLEQQQFSWAWFPDDKLRILVWVQK